MAYDERLANRVRGSLARRRGVSEKKMFGGLSFLVDGKMCCGIVGQKLVVRIGERETARALNRQHTEPMTFTGRPMKSMVYILPGGLKSRASMDAWVNRAVDFTRALSGAGKSVARKK